MNSHYPLFHGGTFQLRSNEAVRLAALDGVVSVISGAVWLTRRTDLQDHVLAAGERLPIAAADAVVVEPWQRDQSAVLRWQPHRRPATQALRGLARRAAAPVLRGVAFAAEGVAKALRRVEAGLAALARSAASMASRAQGSMTIGDSIASCGAVK